MFSKRLIMRKIMQTGSSMYMLDAYISVNVHELTNSQERGRSHGVS